MKPRVRWQVVVLAIVGLTACSKKGGNGISAVASESANMDAAVTPCPKGMALIPGGKYTLGEKKTEATVATYCLDLTEVTVSAYTKCVDAKGCSEPNAYANKSGNTDQFCNWKHPEGREKHPINCVDWEQATKFCASRDARLPSEEEWEWAARNGDKGDTYPWGSFRPDGTRANACGGECPANGEKKGYKGWNKLYDADDGFPETAPVGSFPKGDNRWGVHDLSGNVTEWTESKFDPTKPERVYRGGGWFDFAAAWLSASNRDKFAPSTRGDTLGFRCARSV